MLTRRSRTAHAAAGARAPASQTAAPPTARTADNQAALRGARGAGRCAAATWADAAAERQAEAAASRYVEDGHAKGEAPPAEPAVRPHAALSLAGSGSGEPLAAPERTSLEGFFGADLGRLRIHHGVDAAAVTAAASARAVTRGDDVFFAPGRWAPHTPAGRQLLAHEAAHALQGGAPARNGETVAAPPSETLLAFEYDPATLSDAQIQIDLARARELISDRGTDWLDVQRAQRAFSRIDAELARRRGSASGDPDSEPRYSLRLATHPSLVREFENLARADALRELGHFRGRVSGGLEATAEGLAYMRRIREDQWIVGGISDALGGVTLPGDEIFAPARAALAAGDAAFLDADVVTTAQQYQTAAHHARRAERTLYEYREGTIGGAETAVTGLEGVVVVSAVFVTVGTAGTAGPATAALVGASYSAATTVARQATEVGYGLRDHIDWAGIGFDFAVGLVTGLLGGRLGNAILGRMLANPAAAGLGQRVLAHVTSDLVAGRVGSTLHLAARMAFDDLRGEANVTWETFIDRIAEHLTDPRGALFDVAMGAAFRRAHGAAGTRPPTAPASASALRRGGGFTSSVRARVLAASMRGVADAVPATRGTGAAPGEIVLEAPGMSARAAEPAAPRTGAVEPVTPAVEPAAPRADRATVAPESAATPAERPTAAAPEVEAPRATVDAAEPTPAAEPAPARAAEPASAAIEPVAPGTPRATPPATAEAATRPAEPVVATPTADPLSAEVDLAFAEHPGGPAAAAPAPGAGVVTTAPEVAAGFSPAHVRPLGSMLGTVFTSGPLARLGAIWAAAANPGEAATLTGANSRGLFNNHRVRFWRAVRNDPAAVQALADAGLTFDRGPGSAPSYALPGGRRIRITIDHVVERQSDPSRALDPSNLRLSFSRENSVVLRLLHVLDPFLR